MEKITPGNSGHYKWGMDCDGWHLLKNERLSVIQEKMPPGTFEQIHFHATAQQLFFILEGTATFELNGSEVVVGPRESIHIPPGDVHKISNNSTCDLEFLVISEPPSHGDRQNV
ncbi:MAG: cupin domain-containing protein [Ferruginibacter sp.]|nr:cupin domain-containing protein [Ferruginibacter sp.]